ncbi:sialate O-acetylesterase [Mucilaginibacter mali]|uniref:sialate O-acetylesterase n=1 Tax=Mucilaginibacter mali TaxID=2740462 RepID=UPI001F301339|nr:sialate O-acetylesterase [Mucilaginibacter mali]
MSAGGPYQMDIAASNHITIKNILIGDVWVCSGQSNMEFIMQRAKDKYAAVIAQSDNPAIRQFMVNQAYNFSTELDDTKSAGWKQATPQNVLQFTAVGYFFARELYAKYKVPIGLILSSWGGTPAEAWMSEEALKAFPKHYDRAKKLQDTAFVNDIKNRDKITKKTWYDQLLQDEGLSNRSQPWFSNSYAATDWPAMQMPAYWEDRGMKNVPGVVWFRKEIDLPAAIIGKNAKLVLGNLVDEDSTYVNGVKVGATSNRYLQRNYLLPDDLLKPGKNIITIRLITHGPQGGFVKDKPYELFADGQRFGLDGTWQYKIGKAVEPLPGTTTFPYQPLCLFNGMIHPLLPYTIKGVAWYQGEANASRAPEYRKLFPAMIADWRQHWQQGDFPFVYVQLANYYETKTEPSESNWAALREAQLFTLAVPNTGMAVISDIGEWNDVHPLNKLDVGKRLALAAQKVAYGDQQVVYSGPTYQSMTKNGNKIIIAFKNVGSGLVSKGGELKYFSIAGADKKFVWAKAVINGNTVTVWNDDIANPVAVRYAWADNPDGANLYNKEGLPASLFRTDDWVADKH